MRLMHNAQYARSQLVPQIKAARNLNARLLNTVTRWPQ
jgi:hypothetical protein